MKNLLQAFFVTKPGILNFIYADLRHTTFKSGGRLQVPRWQPFDIGANGQISVRLVAFGSHTFLGNLISSKCAKVKTGLPEQFVAKQSTWQ